MHSFIRLVGPHGTVEILGVKLVGVSVESAKKLLFSIVLIGIALLLRYLFKHVLYAFGRKLGKRPVFWLRQILSLAIAAFVVVVLVSTWFNDPARLATAAGLVTAGVAFALQRVITALAGYVVILRGKTFQVGDRITMGGVRGDVIGLSFMQTRIMEMGQPPTVQSNGADEAWVKSRQYTGRVVTVTNDKIFDEPVYNYTREFPYIWEEVTVPVTYSGDRARAEQILLDAASRHTVRIADLGADALRELERRFFLRPAERVPCVYYRLTDNWIELTVRFIVTLHETREIKDAMSRDIIRDFDAAGIVVASSTFELVGAPPLRVQTAPAPARESEDAAARDKTPRA